MTTGALPIATPASATVPLALGVRDLTGPARMVIVRDVTISVPPGRTRVVLGTIQSGKTMLLRHIVGLERAESGIIEVGGETFRATGEADPAVLRRLRTRLGVVFEGSALFSRLSILENVELPLLEHSPDDVDPDWVRQTARELLAEVGLSAIDDEVLPQQVGRAAQRRVALARALALRPPVVLLDEPTLYLDAHAAHELDELLVQLQARHGFGTLIFSHEVRHAYGAAEHIYVLADGRVVGEGDRAALLANPHPQVQRLLQRRGRRP